jgi:hypothetical protein
MILRKRRKRRRPERPSRPSRPPLDPDRLPPDLHVVQALAKRRNAYLKVHDGKNGIFVNVHYGQWLIASYWPDHGTLRIGPRRIKVLSLLDAWRRIEKAPW